MADYVASLLYSELGRTKRETWRKKNLKRLLVTSWFWNMFSAKTIVLAVCKSNSSGKGQGRCVYTVKVYSKAVD